MLPLLEVSFNSKLVRLKEANPASPLSAEPSFNSKLVRLKATYQPFEWKYDRFNSKLVRLKGTPV